MATTCLWILLASTILKTQLCGSWNPWSSNRRHLWPVELWPLTLDLTPVICVSEDSWVNMSFWVCVGGVMILIGPCCRRVPALRTWMAQMQWMSFLPWSSCLKTSSSWEVRMMSYFCVVVYCMEAHKELNMKAHMHTLSLCLSLSLSLSNIQTYPVCDKIHFIKKSLQCS